MRTLNEESILPLTPGSRVSSLHLSADRRTLDRPNDIAHQPGPLGGRNVSNSRNAAPVCLYQAAQRGNGKALAILAARLARAVYHMLRKGEAFDEERFWNGSPRRNTTGSSSLCRKEAQHAGD